MLFRNALTTATVFLIVSFAATVCRDQTRASVTRTLPDPPSDDSSPSGFFSPLDFCIYNCKFSIEEAKNRLDGFFEKLKSYITPTDFVVEKFKKDNTELEAEFRKIQRFLVHVPATEELRNRLQSTFFMFQVMTDSIKILTSYNNPDVAADGLVYKMVDLKIRVFGLYNSEGFLDTQMTGYKERLRHLWRSLLFWKIVFRDLSNVPIDTRMAFEDMGHQARELMEELADQVTE